MGRLQDEFLVRVEQFADNVLDIAEALAKQGRPRRIVSQIIGSGTSVGANVFEADEAMSRPDFCKCLNVAIKELNETRFWIRLIVRRGRITVESLQPVQAECVELKRILGAILARTRGVATKPLS